MYNKSDFEWVQPKLKSKLAISIPNEHDFNINPRLLAEIPERIGIGYNLQNMTLALSSIPAVVHDIFLLHTHSFHLVAFFARASLIFICFDASCSMMGCSCNTFCQPLTDFCQVRCRAITLIVISERKNR